MADQVATINGVEYGNVAALNYTAFGNIAAINYTPFVTYTFGDRAYLYAGGNTSVSYLTSGSVMNFPTETFSAASATLAVAKQLLAGISNAATYGWLSGGLTGAEVATSERLTFSTATIASNTSTNLSQARGWVQGMSDRSTYGYAVGGRLQAVNTYYNYSDRITFSSNTSARNTSSDLSQAKRYHQSINSGGSYGYTSGGSTNAFVVTNDRLTFSTSTTTASTTYNMTTAKGNHISLSDAVTYGYWSGGSTGAAITLTDRMTFSTGVCAARTVSSLNTARQYARGISDKSSSAVYGYVCGGYTTANTESTERMTFSTGVYATYTTSNVDVVRGEYAPVTENGI
jgi:hypothetical protein